MSNLTEKLIELGKYEIGVSEFNRVRNGDSLAGYALIAKAGFLAMEGVLAGWLLNETYNGNFQEAGKAAALIAGIEAVKYVYCKVEPHIGPLNERLFSYVKNRLS